MARPDARGALNRLTMSSPGNPALRLDEMFVSPPAAEPPPIRRALFIFLLTLAALLHVATAGWGVLYNETDGQYAGGAREMLELTPGCSRRMTEFRACKSRRFLSGRS